MYTRFGGTASLKGKKTGFFHVENLNGKYWLVGPEGGAFFAVGTYRVSYHGTRSPDGSNSFHDNIKHQYPEETKWIKHVLSQVRSWNFNLLSLGPGEYPKYEKIPRSLFLWASHPFARKKERLTAPGVPGYTTFVDIFDPDFEKSYTRICSRVASPLKNDPWLVGYYTDNELFWGFGMYPEHSLLDAVLYQDPSKYSKQELVKFIRSRYQNDLQELKKNWKVSIKSWNDLLSIRKLRAVNQKVIDDKRAFLFHYARHYFKVTSRAIKKADPNHLNLGCRIHGYCEPEVSRAMGEFIDVISYNKYDGIAPLFQIEEMFFREAQKPVLVTEWGFRAMDSGMPNTGGVGRILPDQKTRGRKYTDFLAGLARSPYCVGAIYYAYVDDPPAGGGGIMNNENSNYGLVDIMDRPYRDMVSQVRKANQLAFQNHQVQLDESPVLVINAPKDFFREPEDRFFIQRNGRIINHQYVRAFLHAKGAGTDCQNPVFEMDFDHPVRFYAWVYEVELNAVLDFYLDGKKIASFKLPAGKNKGICAYRMEQGWHSVYDSEFGISIPAGYHTIMVKNSGSPNSWIWLDSFRIHNWKK